MAFKSTAKLNGGRRDQAAITLNYGSFINNVITFMIVAWAVFMLVKAMNVAETKLRLGTEPAADARRRRKTCCCCARFAMS